jgi:hypothetical protein
VFGQGCLLVSINTTAGSGNETGDKRMDRITLRLKLDLASIVDRMLEKLGYAETLELLERECKLVEVGKRAKELSKGTDDTNQNVRP